MFPRPTRSTLFPYTTLFRSGVEVGEHQRIGEEDRVVEKRLRHHQTQAHQGTAALDTKKSMRDLGQRSRAPHAKPDHRQDRKSTRLNSSHMSISYAVFCLKKK